jgi:hypothetical protein
MEPVAAASSDGKTLVAPLAEILLLFGTGPGLAGTMAVGCGYGLGEWLEDFGLH